MRAGSWTRTKTMAAVVAGLIAGASFTAVAYGHGGDDSVIHACVGGNGLVRVVSPTTTCPSPSQPLDWSITGPEGSPGPRGLRGRQGAQGPQGEAGPQGLPGQGIGDLYRVQNGPSGGGPVPTALEASCEPGDILLSGGYQAYPKYDSPTPWEEQVTSYSIWAEIPVYHEDTNRWGWEVTARQDFFPPGYTLNVYALCASRT
jgi:hypothetical protein